MNDERALLLPQERPFPVAINSPTTLASAAILNQAHDSDSYLTLLKDLFFQGWPMVARGIAVSAQYLGISLLLSSVNEDLLAPNTLINAIVSVAMIFGGRCQSIVNSDISRLNGENTPEARERIGVILRHGLIFSALLSIPITVMYYFAFHQIFRLVGQHQFAVDKVREYSQAAAFGFIAQNMLTTQQRLSQAMKQPMHAFWSNLVLSSVSVIFSYLFLNGKLGFPKLEMAGVGYANVIAAWSALLLNTAFLFLKSRGDWRDLKLFSLQGGFEPTTLKMLARKGIPTGIQYSSENIANLINSIFLGLHSLTALSADQMAMQLALISSIANGGLAQAVTSCVGNALGKKKFRAMQRYGDMGIALGIVFPTIAFLVFLFAHEQFISFYIDIHNPKNSDLVRLAGPFLLMECLRQFTTGPQFTATGALAGFKNTDFTMKTSIVFSLGLNAAILALMHFALHADSFTLFSEKPIGTGICMILNSLYWLMVSREQSPEAKAEIKDQNLSFRVKRCVNLLLMKPAVEGQVRESFVGTQPLLSA